MIKAIVIKKIVSYFYDFIGCSQRVVYFDMVPDLVIFSRSTFDNSVVDI